MKTRVYCRSFLIFFILTGFVCCSSPGAYAQGVLLRASGAINESMGGAAIAAPLDSAGAIYHNPASISGLSCNEVSFGLGIIVPKSTVESSIHGMPQTYGSSETEAGELPCPTMSTVFRFCPQSRWTFGLSVAGIGGAAALYPATGNAMSNPVLSGYSRASNVQVFEVMPTAAYKMTDRLSVGFTPVLGLASLSLNPMPFGMHTNSPMMNFGTRYTWGGGFNIGLYYDFKNHWKTGFTFKSPLWADALHFTGTDAVIENGQIRYVPNEQKFQFNLPWIMGWGISYSGIRKTLIALDIRYFDYENTDGFGEIHDANGTITGLGWDSVFSVSVGVERQIRDRFKIRFGYCWNENPIPSESQYANVSAPLFMQHVFSMGGTFALMKGLEVSVAWSHVFELSESGPLPGNVGVVKNTIRADTFLAGITKKF